MLRCKHTGYPAIDGHVRISSENGHFLAKAQPSGGIATRLPTWVILAGPATEKRAIASTVPTFEATEGDNTAGGVPGSTSGIQTFSGRKSALKPSPTIIAIWLVPPSRASWPRDGGITADRGERHPYQPHAPVRPDRAEPRRRPPR